MTTYGDPGGLAAPVAPVPGTPERTGAGDTATVAIVGDDTTRIPAELSGCVQVHGRQVRLTGDDTGRDELYFTPHGGSVLASPTLAPLLGRLADFDAPPKTCASALSYLLHDGVLPLPLTAYEGISRLGPGDRASIARSESAITCNFESDFPYFGHFSRGTSSPDTRHLLDLLCSSLERQLENNTDALLMLSSGKDSTSIALAAAETGVTNLTCVTYSAGPVDDEHEWAARTCSRLGLTHQRVTLTADDPDFETLLRNYFAGLVTPWVDPAALPYLLCLARAGLQGGQLIDGSGNDIYMGYLPSPEDRLKKRLSVGSIPAVARTLEHLVPHYSKLSYLLRNQVEIGFGGRFFRHSDTRKFFDSSFDTTAAWRADCQRHGNLDPVDFRALVRGRHYEQGAVMGKIRAAARHFDAVPVHPFIDRDLIDYYFNLPERERFDRAGWTNKLLLRRMLEKYLDYDAAAIGKRYFQFNGSLFVNRYQKFIVEEVVACRLWNEKIGDLLNGWLSKSDSHPYIWQSIVGLFQISAWHNHSRFAPRT